MARMTTPAELGALGRAARQARGWTQQQAADESGVSRRFVNLFEGGEHRNAEVWRVLALLNALDVELIGIAPTTASSTVKNSPQPIALELSTPEELDLNAHLETFRTDGE